jgi:hypothetical protein
MDYHVELWTMDNSNGAPHYFPFLESSILRAAAMQMPKTLPLRKQVFVYVAQ